jgi:hypothetical protein
MADLVLLGLVERAALSARPGALGVSKSWDNRLACVQHALYRCASLDCGLLPLSVRSQMQHYVKRWAEATELATGVA